MIWIYRIFFFPIFIILLPIYLLKMIRRKGYADGFTQRFGNHLVLPKSNKKRLWVHTVSVGELASIKALLEQIIIENRYELVLTCTTSTAYKILKDRYAPRVLHIGIFPLDFWLFSFLTWKNLQPNCAILTDTELWPEHLHQAKQRGVPVLLLNARLSDRSLHRMKHIKLLVKRLLLDKLTWMGASSNYSAQRFLSLGMHPKRLSVIGNLKFDSAPINSPNKREFFRMQMGFDEKTIALLGSSTWDGEEKMLLEILQSGREKGLDIRLVLAPRHTERKPQIMELLKQCNWLNNRWHARSLHPQAHSDTLIYLIDTTGELAELTQAADIAFIGKSISPNFGGQSPMDAASLGVPIVTGPNMNNFVEIITELVGCKAAICETDAESVKKSLLELVSNPDTRSQMAKCAGKYAATQRGGTGKALAAIAKVNS
jgi:3-deoxy-D-manno-octulosonic-acid transferase